MVQVTESELTTIIKPFKALDELLEDVPENKQIRAQVNLVLKMLSSKRETGMMGASAASKTKGLFEMFHLTNRI